MLCGEKLSNTSARFCCWLWLLVLLLTGECVDADVSDIQIKYYNKGYLDGGNYNSGLTLVNKASTEFYSGDEDVTVYACFIRLVIGSVNGVIVSSDDNRQNVIVSHLDGCAHKLVFDSLRIPARENVSFTLNQEFWMVSYTDIMPNWYIQQGRGQLQLVDNTDTYSSEEFSQPLDRDRQIKRFSWDSVKPWTVEERFDKFNKKYQPNDIEIKSRFIPQLENPLLGTSKLTSNKFIHLNSVSMTFQKNESYIGDAYSLKVNEDGDVEITAANEFAFELCKSTVQQMLERFDRRLVVGEIFDSPRSSYRGFMLDIARHFHDKDTIISVIDLMWRYKLNSLHLHLTDDEAWAIEIDGLPELTEIGAKQCYDESRCATYPQLGRKISDEDDSSRHYLTKQEYIDIINHAKTRGIKIIPEIDLPGHSTAAIKAMRVRYDRNSSDDYRLHDPTDDAKYMSVQYFTKGNANPCLNSTYKFIEKVMQTIQDYHVQAGVSLEIFHIGGDEIAYQAENSTACQTAQLTNAVQVKRHMLKRMGDIAHSKNLALGFWEDGLMEKGENFPINKRDIFPEDMDVYAFTWQTVWEWGGGSRPYNLANADYKIVLAPATHYYLDHPHEPNSFERGYYWATRFSDLSKVFHFRIDNFYENVNGVDLAGTPQSREKFCATEGACPPLVKHKNIIGGQGALFGETMFTKQHIENAMWPRMLAVAERLWHRANWEALNGTKTEQQERDYNLFWSAVERYEIPYLDSSGVSYHLSPPGIDIEYATTQQLYFKLITEFDGQRMWLRKNSSLDKEEINMTIYYPEGDRTEVYLISTSDKKGQRFTYEVAVNLKTMTTAPPVTTPTSGGNVKTSYLLMVAFVMGFSSLFNPVKNW